MNSSSPTTVLSLSYCFSSKKASLFCFYMDCEGWSGILGALRCGWIYSYGWTGCFSSSSSSSSWGLSISLISASISSILFTILFKCAGFPVTCSLNFYCSFKFALILSRYRAGVMMPIDTLDSMVFFWNSKLENLVSKNWYSWESLGCFFIRAYTTSISFSMTDMAVIESISWIVSSNSISSSGNSLFFGSCFYTTGGAFTSTSVFLLV